MKTKETIDVPVTDALKKKKKTKSPPHSSKDAAIKFEYGAYLQSFPPVAAPRPI
jgi:hypothetical protein